MADRVSLKGFIQLEQIEDLLNNLYSRLRHLEGNWSHYQADKENDEMSLKDSLELLHKSTSDLHGRLGSVETRIQLQGDNRDISINEATNQNSKKINEIIDNIKYNYEKKVVVESKLDAISQTVSSELNHIKDTVTPLEITSKLMNTQNLITIKLNHMDDMMNTKVDKSNVAVLQSLYSNLSVYDEFKAETIQRLGQLDSATSELCITVSQHASAIDQLQQNVVEINEKIQRTSHTKHDHQEFLNVFNELVAVVKECESKQAVRGMDDRLSRTVDHVSGLLSNIDGINAGLEVVKKELITKASVTDVKACVLRTHYDEAIMALGSAIDTKAYIADLERTEADITRIDNKLEQESAKVGVAMRFVDWFIGRGENYEHNLRVVDKHLSNLTSVQGPANRDPYVNQVKYTPLMSKF